MKYKFNDLINNLNKRYTFKLQEDFDNTGLQIGNLNDNITGILICMDITIESLNYAVNNNFNCIISHHPLFFNKFKCLEYSSPIYKKLDIIFKNKLNIVSIHTPIDLDKYGISRALADKIKLKNIDFFIKKDDNHGYGFKGELNTVKLKNLIEMFKNIFNFDIIYYGDDNCEINKVAVLGGSGAFSIKNAIEDNIDLLVSSDFKYHDIQYAMENNLNIIDLGHYESEILGLDNLKRYIVDSKEIPVEKIFLFDKNIFKKRIY